MVAQNVFSNKGNFSAPLVVGADGRNSKMRYLANIKSIFFDYNQIAFVFNISHTSRITLLLLKRFYPSGPLALLPMIQNKKSSSIVWTVDESKKKNYLNKKI